MQSDLGYSRNFVEKFRADSVSQLITRGPKTSRLLVSRLRRDTAGHGLVTPPQGDAVFSVLLQLREQKQRELFLDGRCIHRGAYLARTTSVVNHLELPCANLISPFDNLMFTIPQSALNEIADESGVGRVDHLYCEPGGVLDETVWHLGNALLPALERPHEVNSMYAEHVMLGAYTYFAQTFGGMRPSRERPGTLAPWQLKRAMDAMGSQIDADVSLKMLAAASGLSVSYFIRAFKASTGEPPHRWMLRHRVERAKDLLSGTEATLAEIAISCGFADQSHFTRVFKTFVGVSPAAWKRSIRH
ncbi:AraC family transcriptional regulator [Silvimonas amylolytica]|uniref:Transcriptional regulator n=1 Tax=Silvimonas amylolytica TaxID=449663 RepID=A0ABQ2PGX7_9NEIS|nr:AraC family transcriptional regulator [Silvimonas amylolytica]GGP24859.1 transcriptional regulator [Silvimonas amylolytica]